jgi:hypothetical protein
MTKAAGKGSQLLPRQGNGRSTDFRIKGGTTMIRYASGAAMLAIAVLLFVGTNRSHAQGVVLSGPYVSYYQAPAVSYYSPPAVSYSPPVVSYYSAPVVSYYAAPVVSYYAVPATTYYSAPAYYAAPATTVTTFRQGILPWRRTVTTYVYP